MPAYFNRGATFAAEPQLPDDPLIDLLAQTNAKVEYFDLSPDGKSIAYVSAQSGATTSGSTTWTGPTNRVVGPPVLGSTVTSPPMPSISWCRK